MLCHIFNTGKHKDSKGRIKEWTTDDLDKIVYQSKNVHKDSPICVGHPQSNTPAYGWLTNVQRIGNGLYCEFKDVQKEFVEAVKKGLFKNRSLSLDGDLNIRHLAFLGAQAPAIKGLEHFCFADDSNAQTFEMTEFSDIENESKDKNTENERMKMEELEKMQAQLSEKDAQIEKLQRQIAADEAAKKRQEFEDFCEKAIEKGNILPKHKECIVNILTACDDMKTFNFADGGEKSAVDAVKEFVGSLKLMDFKEISKKDDAPDAQNFEDVDSSTIATQLRQMCQKENITMDVAYERLKAKK